MEKYDDALYITGIGISESLSETKELANDEAKKNFYENFNNMFKIDTVAVSNDSIIMSLQKL